MCVVAVGVHWLVACSCLVRTRALRTRTHAPIDICAVLLCKHRLILYLPYFSCPEFLSCVEAADTREDSNTSTSLQPACNQLTNTTSNTLAASFVTTHADSQTCQCHTMPHSATHQQNNSTELTLFADSGKQTPTQVRNNQQAGSSTHT